MMRWDQNKYVTRTSAFAVVGQYTTTKHSAPFVKYVRKKPAPRDVICSTCGRLFPLRLDQCPECLDTPRLREVNPYRSPR
jgi:hypothetical protein